MVSFSPTLWDLPQKKSLKKMFCQQLDELHSLSNASAELQLAARAQAWIAALKLLSWGVRNTVANNDKAVCHWPGQVQKVDCGPQWQMMNQYDSLHWQVVWLAKTGYPKQMARDYHLQTLYFDSLCKQNVQHMVSNLMATWRLCFQTKGWANVRRRVPKSEEVPQLCFHFRWSDG